MLAYLVAVLAAANFNAVIDVVLHPEIPYLDKEHLIEGGLIALVVAFFFGTRELHLARRRRVETALRTTEAQYRTILATAMDGFWITDHEGRFVDVNDAACRHLGYGRAELLGGMRLRDIEAVESSEETAARIRKIREEGKDRFESRHRRKDGTVVDTEISVHYPDAGGGGYVAFVRDITVRKKSEEALRRVSVDLEREVRGRTAELRESNEQLREAQRRQRALLDAIPDVAWLKDREGRLIAVNQSYARRCGIDAADLIGKTDLESWPRELAEKYMADDRRVVESGRIQRIEEPMVGPNGEEAWADTFKVPFFGEGDAVIGTVGIARDVTDRHRAEEALKASEARYRALAEEFRALLDAIPDAVYFKDREGRHRFVNRAFEQSMGLSGDQVIGKGADDLFPPQMAEGCRLSDGEVHETRTVTHAEDAMAQPDGTTRFFETIKAPLFDERGDVVGLVGLTRDITQRKRNEAQLSAYRERLEAMVDERTAALQESEERFRSLVESSLVGFFIVHDGTIVFANPEQKRIFGGRWEECAASDFSCIHPADRERFAALCDGSFAEIDGGAEAVIRQCPDGCPEGEGSVRWLHCRATPLRYRGMKAVLVNMHDITRLKEMERIALAQEKMAALGHVATGVAHQIRNPLSGLTITLGVLGKALKEPDRLRPEARQEAQALFEMAVAASAKIEAIVRRVLDLANPAPPKMVPLSVNVCAQETLHLSGVTLRKEGVRVTTALRTTLPDVRGDACLLEQVLLNLLTNAAQAMEGQEREKHIEIATDARDGHVIVSVADSGPGVPDELREKIFDPFFTTKKGGTGIGLAFSRRVVSDHGGVLDVGRSRFGGALFTLGLPAGGRANDAAT